MQTQTLASPLSLGKVRLRRNVSIERRNCDLYKSGFPIFDTRLNDYLDLTISQNLSRDTVFLFDVSFIAIQNSNALRVIRQSSQSHSGQDVTLLSPAFDEIIATSIVRIEDSLGSQALQLLHRQLAIHPVGTVGTVGTAYNRVIENFIGLHFDMYRDHAPDTIDHFFLTSMNLGRASRYLTVRPIDPHQIQDYRASIRLPHEIWESTETEWDFLFSRSDNMLPFQQYEIPPLSGYIIITTEYIHDGCTDLESSFQDINALMAVKEAV